MLLLTTSISNVALSVGSDSPYEVRFLDDTKAWDLLSRNVFGQEVCPPELEKVGKEIAKSCKGLPLTIVVIGGLLRKSSRTREYWEHVAENVNSVMNTENDADCSKILALSYNNLPIHLKPCFLYMASFPEDSEIRTTRLIRLWVADGFIKPNSTKTLEEVALEYLTDLVDRNLIMIKEKGSSGKMKTCIVHDLLRDFCLIEAQNERFLCVINKKDMLSGLHRGKIIERRFVVNRSTPECNYDYRDYRLPSSEPCARSLIYDFYWESRDVARGCMLRVLGGYHNYSSSDVLKLINSRYLELSECWYLNRGFPILPPLFWNLETIVSKRCYDEIPSITPSEIWTLPHLRHIAVSSRVRLLDPVGGPNSFVLSNLQTLSTLQDFICTDNILERIPNLKKLVLFYDMKAVSEAVNFSRCFNNLASLHKLETLKCGFKHQDLQRASMKWESRVYSAIFRNWTFCNIELKIICAFNEPEALIFSDSLKKLTLYSSGIPWENMTIVGSLPNLEVLKIHKNAFIGEEWNSIEGEFGCLKYLLIDNCLLKTWRVDNTHFPRLERLDLLRLLYLEEIPCGNIT